MDEIFHTRPDLLQIGYRIYWPGTMRPGIGVFHPFALSFVFVAFCVVNLTLHISKVRILCTLLLYDITSEIWVLFMCRHYFFSNLGMLSVLLHISYTHPTQKSEYLPSTARNLTKSEHKSGIALMLLFICCTRMEPRKICIFFRY